MIKPLTVITAAFAAILVAGPALARDIEGGGSQYRGAPGRNAELRSEPVSLPPGCFILSVASEGMDGFWMEGPSRPYFPDANAARNAPVAPGQYRIYPELKANAGRATVRVTFRCPGN